MTIRVEKIIRDLLHELAAAEDRSMNNYLNRIISQHIEEARKNEKGELNRN